MTIAGILVVVLLGAGQSAANTPVRELDAELIQCQVEHLVRKNAWFVTFPRSVKRARAEGNDKIIVDDQFIMRVIDNVCNPLMKFGEWVSTHDIVFEAHHLVLIDQKKHGECRVECRLIEHACHSAMKTVADDLYRALLSENINERRVPKDLCATTCASAQPPLDSYLQDEVFLEQDPDERKGAEINEVMRMIGAASGQKARVIRPEEMKKRLSPGRYKKEEL